MKGLNVLKIIISVLILILSIYILILLPSWIVIAIIGVGLLITGWLLYCS